MAKTLAELRTAIDALDLDLLTLLNQRASLAHEVGELKKIDGSAVFRPDRETQVIANLQAHNQGPLKDHSLG
ncbi:MAG: chorismate mutase, partial [Betaproteobacteria bacterium]|nr:chorismate mutase [Betaproteobacteria bacterium]